MNHRGACARLVEGLHSTGVECVRRYLEGEQSPWKDRSSFCWQRQHDDTDSSVEESLEADAPRIGWLW